MNFLRVIFQFDLRHIFMMSRSLSLRLQGHDQLRHSSNRVTNIAAALAGPRPSGGGGGSGPGPGAASSNLKVRESRKTLTRVTVTANLKLPTVKLQQATVTTVTDYRVGPGPGISSGWTHAADCESESVPRDGPSRRLLFAWQVSLITGTGMPGRPGPRQADTRVQP
jgi:hypothetical protein